MLAIAMRVVKLSIDLPFPPSINSNVARARAGNYAPDVQAWHKVADLDLRQQGLYGRRLHERAIRGVWGISIVWSEDFWLRWDLDNRVKYLLDYLCSRELVEDDKKCRHMEVDWGCAPRGCRVQLWEVHL